MKELAEITRIWARGRGMVPPPPPPELTGQAPGGRATGLDAAMDDRDGEVDE